MTKDDSGQFLLLTSIVVAVGLVVLLIFINQSSFSGYSSSESIMNFPKNDIRDLRFATSAEVQQIGIAENNNPLATNRAADMVSGMAKFGTNVHNLYAQQGNVVNVTCLAINPGESPGYPYLDAVQIMLNYSNGDTTYGEIYLVVLNSSYGAMLSQTGTASKIVLTPAAGINQSGHGSTNPFVVTVTAYDANNTVVAGYNQTVTLGTNPGTLYGTKTHTFTTSDYGAYTFTGLYYNSSGTYQITATDGTLTSSPINVILS